MGLTYAQIIALAFIVGGALFMWWRWKVTPDKPGIYETRRTR
jgi:hypothetical protein